MTLPVVTSALDAIRALHQGQPVAFHGSVADQLVLWGFTISAIPLGTDIMSVPRVDHGRVTLATDIISGLGQDFTINASDPVTTAHDTQPKIILPDLTVFITGPLSGLPGDGTLLMIARLNPDRTPAYTMPQRVPSPLTATSPRRYFPTQAAGLSGFGQLDPHPTRGGVVVASIPLSTEAMQAVGGGLTAGQIVAFSGTMAGQVLEKLPFAGGIVSTIFSGAKMFESPRGANVVQFLVDAATGGGGIVGTALRVALPALATAQVIADFAAGDARSLWQATATLLTAPLAVLYGPAGAAAQGATRWFAGKAYDWYHEREINAAADEGIIEGTALMAGDPIGQDVLAYNYAQEQAVLQGLTTDIMVQRAKEAAAKVFGDLAAETAAETQQTQDIQAYADELAAYTGLPADPQAVADGLGVELSVVLDALEPPPLPEPVPVAPVPDVVPSETVPPGEVTDVTGQPVLPPVEAPIPLPDPRLAYTLFVTEGSWPGMMGSAGACGQYVRTHGGWCRGVDAKTGAIVGAGITWQELQAAGL